MKKFLIIRRDNIGDLICTTPLFEALKARFPDAAIHALVNSYNSAVLEGNPNVSKIHVYEKLKHQENILSVPGAVARRIQVLIKLRKMRFDYGIIAGSGFQPRVVNYLRWIRPAHVIGYVAESNSASRVIDLGLPVKTARGLHEVEAVFRLLTKLDIHGIASSVKVYPKKTAIFDENSPEHRERQLCVGVHISSRKPSQRWPVDKFVEFIRQLRERYSAKVLLFWSPGAESNERHPGDDDKANMILSQLNDPAVVPMATSILRDLIDAMAEPDLFVCSDGGAMHIAAGLGKPILCLFGDSDRTRWRPWGVPYVLLQPDSKTVSDISLSDAANGFSALIEKVRAQTKKIPQPSAL